MLAQLCDDLTKDGVFAFIVNISSLLEFERLSSIYSHFVIWAWFHILENCINPFVNDKVKGQVFVAVVIVRDSSVFFSIV